MANMFEDMMKGLDEVDAILAEETNSQAPENQPLLNQEVVDRAAKAETSEPKHSIMEFRGLGRKSGKVLTPRNTSIANRIHGMSNRRVSISLSVCLMLACSHSNAAQSTPAATTPSEISADLGPCSALIIVTNSDSKPIYGAKVTTRIQYGLLGVKKLDLEAYSGADGRIKITNLPETLKKPMYIHIAKDDMQEIEEFKPEVQCHATLKVQLK